MRFVGCEDGDEMCDLTYCFGCTTIPIDAPTAFIITYFTLSLLTPTKKRNEKIEDAPPPFSILVKLTLNLIKKKKRKKVLPTHGHLGTAAN